MESFQDAHYYKLPNQGNIYSFTNLQLTNGMNKVLIAILKRKIFCCELINGVDGSLKPCVKEVPFTYIPPGAEIISIDSFNRSSTRDDFFIGIAIIKVNNDQSAETYLNVYTEQEIEEGADLNLESIAQNCLMLELTFTPYHLIHTYLINMDFSKEVVWLMSGSDLKVHLFREDPQNHTYCETDISDAFPEFSSLPSVVLWIDVKHTRDLKRRLTAFGCECGFAKFVLVDSLNGTTLQSFSEQYDAPISSVLLFSLENTATPRLPLTHTSSDRTIAAKLFHEVTEISYNLLIMNSLHPAVVFMNILENGFNEKHQLPDSDKYDTPLCICHADINMDMQHELLIGTFAQALLLYRFDGKWILEGTHKFPHALHSINYIDITGDGVNELIVVTMSGIHIFQHKPPQTLKLFNERLKILENILRNQNCEEKDDILAI
ncbi:KICSTOR complex protein kaptin-like isoform X2 [Cimex lectularius]|uniref:Kaptin n=1 Tax=Cimex lectularius TaxID=79782 RepID=A0A8I6RCV4_CIMLE|nr:KICSTOR complex protein kaptin-like isoform X2 [Cimex lectularius]